MKPGAASWGLGIALKPGYFPALSLRQPWAWAVLHANKRLENRCWSTTFRGRFLIHASKTVQKQEYKDALYSIQQRMILDGREMGLSGQEIASRVCPPAATIERGGFVGVAELTGVLSPCGDQRQRLMDDLFGWECPHPWHYPDEYAFVLENVRPLPFHPYKGALGFFGVPDALAQELLAKAA